jgi:hypothetical protein
VEISSDVTLLGVDIAVELDSTAVVEPGLFDVVD